MVNVPSASVKTVASAEAVRGKSSTLARRASTVTPGSGRPVASVTVPVSVPSCAWAANGADTADVTRNTARAAACRTTLSDPTRS